jgi:hypothetical protein
MTNILDGLAKPPPPLSELDELMARDPLDLSSQDIDAIIAHQRQARARRESGGRTRKASADQPKQSLDLAALGLVKKPPVIPTPNSVPGVVRSFRRL